MGQHLRFWYTLHIHKCLINTHADVYSRTRGLSFGLSLHLHLYFASSYGSGADSPEPLLSSLKINLLHADGISTGILCNGHDMYIYFSI